VSRAIAAGTTGTPFLPIVGANLWGQTMQNSSTLRQRHDPIDLRDATVRRLLGDFIARDMAELAREDRKMRPDELEEHLSERVLPRFRSVMDGGLRARAARLMMDPGSA